MKNKKIGFLVLVSMAMGCSMQPIPPTEDVMPRQDVSLTETMVDVASSMEASQDAAMVTDATDVALDAALDVGQDAARDSALIQDSSMTDGSDAALDAALEASRDASGDSSDASRSDAMGDVVSEESAAPSPRLDNVLYSTRESRLILYQNVRPDFAAGEFFTKIYLTQRYNDSGVCVIAMFEFSDGVNHCRTTDSDGGGGTIGGASPTYSRDYQQIGFHYDGGVAPPGAYVYSVTLPPNPCFATLSRTPGAVSVTINISSTRMDGECTRSFTNPTVWTNAMTVSAEP